MDSPAEGPSGSASAFGSILGKRGVGDEMSWGLFPVAANFAKALAANTASTSELEQRGGGGVNCCFGVGD